MLVSQCLPVVPELGEAGGLAVDSAGAVGQRGDLALEHRGVDLARVKVPGAPALWADDQQFGGRGERRWLWRPRVRARRWLGARGVGAAAAPGAAGSP